MVDNIIAGFDISMRSSGLVVMTQNGMYYTLIRNSILKDEELLFYIWNEIKSFILKYSPSIINLEGVSYDSVSNSKDFIDGLHWWIRGNIKKDFPKIQLNIVEVSSWRSPLFNKDERAILKEKKQQLKLLKDNIKDLTKEEKKEIIKNNEDLVLNANIKYLTFKKLSDNLQEEFGRFGYTKGTFDLTDAYWLANHKRKI